MFKAIIVIVLIVVTVNACTEEEKKTIVKNTKETGSFLNNIKNAFVKGVKEMGVKNKKELQASMDSLNKRARAAELMEMKAYKKNRIKEDAILKEQRKNFVRQ